MASCAKPNIAVKPSRNNARSIQSSSTDLCWGLEGRGRGWSALLARAAEGDTVLGFGLFGAIQERIDVNFRRLFRNGRGYDVAGGSGSGPRRAGRTLRHAAERRAI